MQTQKDYSLAFFRKMGRIGGKINAKKGREYFKKIAAMRKNPGRKPKKLIDPIYEH